MKKHIWRSVTEIGFIIFLFYSNHDPEKAAFLDELHIWQKANANFTFVPTVTTPNGSSWLYERGRIDGVVGKGGINRAR